MENKTIYIGLTENPELTPIKNYYKISRGKKSYSLRKSSILYISYYPSHQEQFTNERQFRREEWEQAERNAYRITSMVAIKNNLEEGERIFLTWE